MNDKKIMKTLKYNKRDLKVEYIIFCNDMLYDSNNKIVKEDFAKAYGETIRGQGALIKNINELLRGVINEKI